MVQKVSKRKQRKSLESEMVDRSMASFSFFAGSLSIALQAISNQSMSSQVYVNQILILWQQMDAKVFQAQLEKMPVQERAARVEMYPQVAKEMMALLKNNLNNTIDDLKGPKETKESASKEPVKEAPTLQKPTLTDPESENQADDPNGAA